MSSGRPRSLWVRILVWAGLGATLAVVLGPFLWMVLGSFKTPPELNGVTGGFLPQSLNFDNYRKVADTNFLAYFVNSGIIAIGTTTIAVVLAVSAGYGFARFRFKGRRLLLVGVVSMQMFPAVLMAIPIYKILRRMQLLDTRLGLVLVYVTFALPFCVWIMRNYFLTVPIEIEESALIDGCNRFTALWRIVLPPALPGVAAASAFCIIRVWDEFLYANTFINTDAKRPLSVGLYSLIGEFTTDWGRLLAAGLLMLLPVLLLFGLLQRYLTEMASGGVKG